MTRLQTINDYQPGKANIKYTVNCFMKFSKEAKTKAGKEYWLRAIAQVTKGKTIGQVNNG